MSSPTPSSGYGATQRRSSMSSHTSARSILAPAGSNSLHPDQNFSSLRSPTSGSYQREPTRSFVHLSYRGELAPVDSNYARSVREDTAALASYAISDPSGSSPPRTRTSQMHLDTYFTGVENESSSNRETQSSRHETIEEVSEPVTPEERSEDMPHAGSGIANLIRISPPNILAPNEDEGIGRDHDNRGYSNGEAQDGRLIITSNGVRYDSTERTPLLAKAPAHETHHDWITPEQDLDLESQYTKRRISWPKLRNVLQTTRERGSSFARTLANPKHWDKKALWENCVKEPVNCLPAVLLGLLLNVLDALSYGMILFPLGSPVFANLGSAGISMFYISCIVSQVVFSGGASIFKAGIGSEMIEVVPFFHKMAFTILARVGEDKPEAVIATTITSYAISTVLTGLVFFLMGTCRFGHIVGFIPRHILIGCIGGVGWFLIATGFEVTARLDGNLNYDLATLKKMFQSDTVPLWIIPLAYAIFYFWSQGKITSSFSKYYLPASIMCIPAIFYFFIFTLQENDLSNLRQNGWIFDSPEAGEPWWYFYTLFKFSLVRWDAVVETIPAMFALTFFGILHVPINVPALANNIGEDNCNIDRELIAHGISNMLSGFVGSIQNYLVYSNSVVFIKSGGTTRLAGIMLAIATFGILLVGPALVGYIPVMMVGGLIFVLGLELLEEAVWEPRKKLNLFEYLTVIAIVLIMGLYDFVAGVFAGIGLAFISLVVQTSRVPAVRASYSGEIAGSTVRRSAVQTRYLRNVGEQIHVTKLAGYLFFGTIVSVEKRMKDLIEDEAFQQRPIRFLILDLWHVTGLDYSAAEAFSRLDRIFSKKGVTLLISGVNAEGRLGLGLRAVGLGQDDSDVKLFADLNSALESCENDLLRTLYARQESGAKRNASVGLDVPSQSRGRSASHVFDTQFSSPRRNQLFRMATTAVEETIPDTKYANFKEPLRLILQTFQGLTEKNEDFWFRAVPFFTKKQYAAGTTLYNRGEPAKGFYLLEQGILRADYELPQGRYFESIVAGTTCGELPFFSETDRTATVQAEQDCVAWLMDTEKWKELQKKDPDVAQELLRISLKMTSERMSAITSYVLTTAG